MNSRIGFMQGRLSPLIDGQIQAFPWGYWQDEFALAKNNSLSILEWTLDQDRLFENPLMTPSGREQISVLCNRHQIDIPSLTGDCFMHAPFWKALDGSIKDLQDCFLAVCEASALIGIRLIVVPLVDNGRLENSIQEENLVNFLVEKISFFEQRNLQIVFESDFAPKDLARFIDQLPEKYFGINYDIGNSASLGFDPSEELNTYGSRITNVHVKDRALGGTTVPLGAGAADFATVFDLLNKNSYEGNYILQTARSADEKHAEILSLYRDNVNDWLESARN